MEMAPSKTTFQWVFHFHVSELECINFVCALILKRVTLALPVASALFLHAVKF